MPYVPTLPNISPYESIIWHDSEFLPGRVIDGNKLYVDRSIDFSEEMEQIYLDFMELNTDRHAASSWYGSGYHEMERRDLSSVWCAKCQVTGPVTFGLTITDQDRRPLAYDDRNDMLSNAGTAGRMVRIPASESRCPRTLVVVDEPYSLPLDHLYADHPCHSRCRSRGYILYRAGGIGFVLFQYRLGSSDVLNPAVISLDAYGITGNFSSIRINCFIPGKGGIIA